MVMASVGNKTLAPLLALPERMVGRQDDEEPPPIEIAKQLPLPTL